MFAILPAKMNIYHLKQRNNSANINDDLFDNIVVEYNIGKADE